MSCHDPKIEREIKREENKTLTCLSKIVLKLFAISSISHHSFFDQHAILVNVFSILILSWIWRYPFCVRVIVKHLCACGCACARVCKCVIRLILCDQSLLMRTSFNDFFTALKRLYLQMLPFQSRDVHRLLIYSFQSVSLQNYSIMMALASLMNDNFVAFVDTFWVWTNTSLVFNFIFEIIIELSWLPLALIFTLSRPSHFGNQHFNKNEWANKSFLWKKNNKDSSLKRIQIEMFNIVLIWMIFAWVRWYNMWYIISLIQHFIVRCFVFTALIKVYDSHLILF